MDTKNPEILQSEKANFMSFVETQASSLEEAEKREQHETDLKDLCWKEKKSRNKDHEKLTELENKLDLL